VTRTVRDVRPLSCSKSDVLTFVLKLGAARGSCISSPGTVCRNRSEDCILNMLDDFKVYVRARGALNI